MNAPRPPRVDPLLLDRSGHVESLLGNEAIVRGAIEAGVAFACGYPGTPSSEITDTFARLAPQLHIPFEYSVNEKVALEMAFAASLAGARSICAMKHLGLMYAGDPLSTIPYVGAVGGLVIVSAGDPSCYTSPNEQDQRHLAPMLHLPMLDPSTVPDARAMTRFAFDLSEKSSLPVILRPTTRVCHTRAPVTFENVQRSSVRGFVRDPTRFVPIPVNARRLRLEIKQRLATARTLLEASPFNHTRGRGKLAIVAQGAPAATIADILADDGLYDNVVLLTVGAVYPLPEDLIATTLAQCEQALVVEELSPYLEDATRAICQLRNVKCTILGKRTDHLPEEFEYDPDILRRGLRKAFGLGAPERTPGVSPVGQPAAQQTESHAGPPAGSPVVPSRPPTLCPGCPHRSTYFAARTALGADRLYFNDIGCYTLGYDPPLNMADALLSMGAGLTLAAGVSRVTGQRTVGFIGDGTFLHSGAPALLNAVKEHANIIAVILDNQVTAMTGFQESPGISIVGQEIERSVSIEALVKSLGVEHVEKIDPYDLPTSIEAFERARNATGVSVVIAERACPIFAEKHVPSEKDSKVFHIDPHACQSCGREQEGLRCEQCTTEPYERHMSRSRAMETQRDPHERQEVAPCSVQCPLSLCVQGYIGHVAAGQYDQALELILSRTPLPDVVCRVCHRPCETACPRGLLDEPIAINELKRFVVEQSRTGGEETYAPRREPPNGLRVAVVGAGPSGLSAAHDLVLRGYDVSLFDAAEWPGGMLELAIPDYRLPRDALARDVERVLHLGVTFSPGRVLGKNLHLHELLEGDFAAVYLAIGAHRPLGLKIPPAPAGTGPEIIDALAYLKHARRNEDVRSGSTVLVVGGGNTAIDAARTALRRGAVRVTILCPELRHEMTALPDEIAAAEREGIEIRAGLLPVRWIDRGLACVKTAVDRSAQTERTRRPFVATEGLDIRCEASRVIVAIGQAVAEDFLTDRDPVLERHEDGTLRVDGTTGQTSHPRVFAGGDMAAGARMVTRAMASGQRAAWGIDRSLRGLEQADKRTPPARRLLEVLPTHVSTRRADHHPRQQAPELEPPARARSFAEVAGTLTESQARLEASRCLVCGSCGNCRACMDLFGCPAFYIRNGKPTIDPALCTGCGVCEVLCPNGAIRPVSPARPSEERPT